MQNQDKRAASRWGVVAVLVTLALLALAYFDAGEEPVRPIVEPIAHPTLGGDDA